MCRIHERVPCTTELFKDQLYKEIGFPPKNINTGLSNKSNKAEQTTQGIFFLFVCFLVKLLLKQQFSQNRLFVNGTEAK